MRTPTHARTALLLGCLTGATMIVSTPSADARTVEFPQVPTTFGGALCAGNVRVWADTDPQWGGRAIFNVKATPIVGYGAGEYSFAPLCENLTTVAWRNMTTGAAGEYRVTVVAGIYGSIQYAQYVDTGPGHIVVTSFTDMANIPQRGEFDVPAALPAPPPEPEPQ